MQWLCGTVLAESLDQKKKKGVKTDGRSSVTLYYYESLRYDWQPQRGRGPQGPGKAKLGMNPSRRWLLSTLTNSRQLRRSESRQNVRCRNSVHGCEGIVTVGVSDR